MPAIRNITGSFLLLLLALASARSDAEAQSIHDSGPWHQAPGGSEEEIYLRALQIGGTVPDYPWSLRNLTSTDLTNLTTSSDHPWAGRFNSSPAYEARIRVLPFRFRSSINALFPQGEDDGAAWAGRGFSVAGNFGAEYVNPWVEIRIAPTAVWAQNGAFPLEDSGFRGKGEYADPYYGGSFDSPQRFGSEPVSRLGWGESAVRVNGLGFEVGASSANQVWGPAESYPLLLSADGPGFLHAFVGTSQPLKTLIGSFDWQVQWGRLDHSEYSPVETLADHRLMAGWVLSYQPALLDGLEVGAARFFHESWPNDSIGYSGLLRPFDAFLARDVGDGSRGGNQLVSVFARWVFPASGLEIYGEFGRDDYSYRFRDFLLEPEHTSAFLVGGAKSWHGARRESLWLARLELLNAAPSQITRIRFAGPFSIHHIFREGHTHLGQPLGTSAAKGGGAARISLSRYSSDGRWTTDLAREVRGEPPATEWNGKLYPVPVDVLYSFGAERLYFLGPLEVGAGFRAGYNVERNLEADAFNVSVGLVAVYRPS